MCRDRPPLPFPAGGSLSRMGGRAGANGVRKYEPRCNLETGMIGVALAQWLVEDARLPSLDQHLANRLGNALGGKAEQLEQLTGRSGLPEAIDPDDRPGAADVLVPKTGRAGLNRNAR